MIKQPSIFRALPVLAMLFSGAAMATQVPSGTYADVACTLDSVKIATVETSPLDSNGIIYSGQAINSTSCQGLYFGNDYDGNWNSTGANISQMGSNSEAISLNVSNTGVVNDGLLNGEGGLLSTTWFQPLPALPQSPLLDLDGNGVATDPGWIRLGKIENGTYKSDSIRVGDTVLNIDDILNISMNCTSSGCTSGTWTLETELNVITVVQALLGRNAFDHLAFVLKSSDRFAVYDFDFNLLSQGLPGFNYTTPYSFTGSWDTNDFMNPNNTNAQAISHISIWARDPAGTSEVPEPASLLLVGLGLGFAALSLRRKKI